MYDFDVFFDQIASPFVYTATFAQKTFACAIDKIMLYTSKYVVSAKGHGEQDIAQQSASPEGAECFKL